MLPLANRFKNFHRLPELSCLKCLIALLGIYTISWDSPFHIVRNLRKLLGQIAYLPRECEGVQVHDVHVPLVRSDVQPFGFEC
jgi:hypothetical protein